MPDVNIVHETPVVISTAASTQLAGATRLDTAGRFVYIPAPDNNFVDVIDISNPSLMERVNGFTGLGIKPIDIAVSGKYAYVSTLNKLQVVDISDIGFLPVIGETVNIGTDLRDIFIVGKYALVLVQSPTPKLSVIDIEDPLNPVEVNSLTLNNTPVRGHYNFGYIYTADAEGGAHIIDVNDPLNPVIKSHLNTTNYPELVGDGKDVYVSGRWMYVLLDNPAKMVLLDLGDLVEPAAESPFTVTSAKTIEIHGDHAYLSSGEIVDVSDPFNLVSLVNGGFNADMITMIGKNGYGLVNNQLKSYSYSGIDSPTGNIYSLKTSKLTVFDDITACNNVKIHNKLSVGIGGLHCDGDVKAPNLIDKTDPRLSDARTPLAHLHPESNITNLVSDLAGKEPLLGFTPENLANKGAVNGYPILDANGNLDLAGKSIKNGGGDDIIFDVQQIMARGTKTERFVMFRNKIVGAGTNIGNFRARSLNDANVEVNYCQFLYTVEETQQGNEHGSTTLRAFLNGNSTDFISYNKGKSGEVKCHRPFDMSSQIVKNVADPVDPQDAVTKKHADDTFLIPATNTVHVRSMSDFPAPVSGVITLGVDTTYILANSIVTSDRFVIPDQSSNFITSGNANVSLTYIGSDTLFTTANDATDGLLTLISLDIQSSGLATLFNLKNQGLDVFRCGLFNFADMGIVRNAPFTTLKFSLVFFMGKGLKIIDSSITDIHRGTFVNSVDTNLPYITIIGNNPATIINTNLFNRLTNETVVFIDPNLVATQGGTIISDIGGTVGAGFFKVGTTGSVTEFANSTVESGVKTKVTSVSHALIDDEAVVITGTTNYNGTFLISNVTTDTFDIEKVFSVDDVTGTWDTSSLDEKNPLIRVREVAFQKPSFSIADAQHNTSTTTIITTVDEIVTLGNTNWTKGSATERFTIGADGIIIYIGLEPTTFKIEARTIISKDGGGSDLIEVGFKVNGVVDFNSLRGVDNAGPAPCNPAIIKTFSKDDTVQIVGRNRTTTKDIILDTSNILITAV